MPERFHALIWPSERADPSRIVPSLKERAAKFILKNLQAHRELPWCRRMLAALTLPPTVRLRGPDHVWQRRFYDLNVGSEKKRREKLDYMYGNPVLRAGRAADLTQRRFALLTCSRNSFSSGPVTPCGRCAVAVT